MNDIFRLSDFVFRGPKVLQKKNLIIFINLSWRYGTSKFQKRKVSVCSKNREMDFSEGSVAFDVMYHIDEDIKHEVTKAVFSLKKVFVEGKNKILYIFEKI